MTTPTTSVMETTDESVALVLQSNGHATVYHAAADGDPACGQEGRKSCSDFREWDIETARAWRDPCSYCYPDGDPR